MQQSLLVPKRIKKTGRVKNLSGLIKAIPMRNARQHRVSVKGVSQGELKEKKDDSLAVRC